MPLANILTKQAPSVHHSGSSIKLNANWRHTPSQLVRVSRFKSFGTAAGVHHIWKASLWHRSRMIGHEISNGLNLDNFRRVQVRITARWRCPDWAKIELNHGVQRLYGWLCDERHVGACVMPTAILRAHEIFYNKSNPIEVQPDSKSAFFRPLLHAGFLGGVTPKNVLI